MVTIKRGGWSQPQMEVLLAWAQEKLGVPGQFKVEIVNGRHQHFLGRAFHFTTRFGHGWRIKLHIPTGRFTYPYVPQDPRLLPFVNAWVAAHPACPLIDDMELMCFVLGHELWHLVDPFSCGHHFTRKQPTQFNEMERRCDEAGLLLVEHWRAAAPRERMRAAQERHDDLSRLSRQAGESLSAYRNRIQMAAKRS